MEYDLKKFFKPESIAVIGASKNLNVISGKSIKYLKNHGYKGRIYAVNPKYDEIEGFPCYKSIDELPEAVDLVLTVVNAKIVIDTIRECGEKGCKFAIVVSSGFAEAGEEGKFLQEQLKEISKKTGIRICGPNSQGFFNLIDGVAASFSSALELQNIKQGNIGFVSQSGAFGYSTFCLGQEEGMGFSYVVASGNEVDLQLVDFLEFMLNDDNTELLTFYAEGIRNGAELRNIAERALELGKPITCVKVGRTELGKKAASSHTAALAGADEVFDALTRQYGIIRVEDVYEIFNIARLMQVKGKPWGSRIAIVSTSGGAGVMMADQCIKLGLQVPALSADTHRKLEGVIPSFGSAMNPVDVTANVINDPEGFKAAIRLLSEDSGIDVIAVLITMVTGNLAEQVARCLADICQESHKPIIIAWSVSESLIKEAYQIVSNYDIPCFKTPVQAASALEKIVSYHNFRQQWVKEKKVSNKNWLISKKAQAFQILDESSQNLTEYEAKKLLALYDIPVTEEYLATNLEEAVKYAAKIGYPVVLKIVSPQIAHKTEIGGVKLGICDEEGLIKAYNEILNNCLDKVPEGGIHGILIQRMVEKGVEIILGAKKDPQFGMTLMFGLGGIFVEVLKDVSLRIVPVDRFQAGKMLEEIKGRAILEGVRGGSPLDVEVLKDIITKFSELLVDTSEEVEEIDINPLVLSENGAISVDALVIKSGENPKLVPFQRTS